MAELRCIVVTPEMTVLEQTVDFVAVPLFDGELGVSPRHAPLIGRLGYGEMRLKQGATTTSYYVDGGFVQVASDTVSVLTNRAIPLDKIDPKAAAAQLAEALERKAHSLEELAKRDRLESEARAQLRLARKIGAGRTANI